MDKSHSSLPNAIANHADADDALPLPESTDAGMQAADDQAGGQAGDADATQTTEGTAVE